jgi:TetR/AcrR family transcriptional regulator, tetracycline repressor protein
MTARRRNPARQPPRTAGQRADLSRVQVLEEARRIAERDGIDGVTMRRLATALGVMPNALYTYFPSKVAILDAILDDTLAAFETGDLTAGRWQDGLANLMRASRRILLAHPHLVPLFLSRPGGPNALRLGEATLQLLERGGVRGRKAVEACRALLVYTMGFVAIEVPRATDPESAERSERTIAAIESLPEERFSATRALAPHLARHPGDRDFETGLHWLLEGIAGTADRRR